jgi:hypothetical protein
VSNQVSILISEIEFESRKKQRKRPKKLSVAGATMAAPRGELAAPRRWPEMKMVDFWCEAAC